MTSRARFAQAWRAVEDQAIGAHYNLGDPGQMGVGVEHQLDRPVPAASLRHRQERRSKATAVRDRSIETPVAAIDALIGQEFADQRDCRQGLFDLAVGPMQARHVTDAAVSGQEHDGPSRRRDLDRGQHVESVKLQGLAPQLVDRSATLLARLVASLVRAGAAQEGEPLPLGQFPAVADELYRRDRRVTSAQQPGEIRDSRSDRRERLGRECIGIARVGPSMAPRRCRAKFGLSVWRTGNPYPLASILTSPRKEPVVRQTACWRPAYFRCPDLASEASLQPPSPLVGRGVGRRGP